MKNRGIGISLNADMVNGDLAVLEQHLGYIADSGCDYAELIMHGLDIVINGQVHPKRLERVRSVLSKFRLGYTLHLPYELNLMSLEKGEDYYRCFEAGIELSAAIGCDMIVYHSSYAQLTDKNLEHYYEKYGKMYREKLYAILLEEDVERLRSLGNKAQQHGIQIGIENNIWYDLKCDYTYGLRPQDVVEHVRRIGLDNVGITLDIGHCYLTSIAHGYDFEQAIVDALPFVKHLHVHNNFGKLKDAGSYMSNLPYGYGDLHLPVGWGSIPYADVFRWIDGYEGIVNMEIEFRLYPHFRESVEEMKLLIAGIQDDNVAKSVQSDLLR
ncbi:sugar phosphate isomerase/epimerase [Paenibacillus sp. OV219]|uniref:sugar phosphate isomerase/epimerase family protein n=1 Tax=Paenibacillus sp. OV219 TaxID=1884377 RepID=UPI0008CE35A1|nr:sugar phosphate isomerase/epimerase family protein [Paenibacillus sp. OV219]SEP13029.1 Sugar phosphate isomerase/epimerase [Paenibacillus sp. OV219]